MLLKRFLHYIKSKNLILIIALSWLFIIGISKPWQKCLIVNDVISYYSYLPATFIEKDITLKFTEKDTSYIRKYWPERAPNNARVIKTTMGLSFLYAPFFFIGHATATLFHLNADGYSLTYQVFLLLSCLFYLLLGFYFLRKLLLLYFSEGVTCLTMISVFFGTNLLWYSTFSGLMSHGYLFTFVTIFIYLVVKWHSEPKIKTAIFLGLTAGLLILIRPTMILCFLIFALYNVYNKQSLLEKFYLFKNKFFSIIVITISCLIVILPQLLYWKYITGNYLFFSYVGERFYWDNPHIIEGLFGFRKGWLIYTPIMSFAVIGIFYLRKSLPAFFLSLAILFPLLVYIFFSWWAWWYGGSFGLRAFVDFYGLFSIPMACFYTRILQNKKNILRRSIVIITFLLIYLNLFQTWQYKRDLIHYDSMTREAYIIGFSKTYNLAEWFGVLDAPDYDRARKGLPEYYSEEEIKKIIPSNVISLRGYNQLIITCETALRTLSSSKFDIGESEKFSFIYQRDNKVAIKASNGKYVSVNPGLVGKLYAESDVVGPRQLFEVIYLQNGRIALKAFNNKYVGVEQKSPFELYAKSEEITPSEMLRIYIK